MLRSAKDIQRCPVYAADGEVGHVEDFVVDDEDWAIRYVGVDTSNWSLGKKVLISPHWVSEVSWNRREVCTDLESSEIKSAPEWDPDAPIDYEYEIRLHEHYGRPRTGSTASRPSTKKKDAMKQVRILALAVLISLTLAGCGGGQTQGNTPENEDEAPTQAAGDEVVIGGFSIDGPAGREISIPETVAEREDVENYVQTVRPIVEQSALGLFRFIDPSAELQEGTLTIGIGVEPIEEARAEVDDGLAALQLISPPEDMEPVHELLIAAYVQGVSGYDNIIDAFESGDLEVLTNALQENLPEIEQLTAETRAILQELNRIETVNTNDQAESRG